MPHHSRSIENSGRGFYPDPIRVGDNEAQERFLPIKRSIRVGEGERTREPQSVSLGYITFDKTL